VLTADELLEEGEKLYGYYNIEIARWTETQWVGTMPPIFAIVSDQRLIMQAQTRKRYPPAIIPRSAILRVDDLDDGRHYGLMIYLKNEMMMCVLIPGQQFKPFARNMKSLAVPPSPVEFTPKVELNSLKKIINCVECL